MKNSTVLFAASVISLLCSCYSYKEISELPEIKKYEGKKHVHVLKANVDSNVVFFSEKLPGKLSDKGIVGIHQFPMFRITADSIFFKPVKYKRIIDYVYKDGIRYDVFEEKHQVFLYSTAIPVNIPYTALKSVDLKVFRPGATAVLIGSSSAAWAGLLILTVLSMSFSMDWSM